MLPVQPGPHGYFEFDLAPGARTQLVAIVRNLGSARASYSIYSTDATTAPVGGVAYGQQNPPPAQTGAWVQPHVRQLTLDAGTSAQARFSVTVPAGAASGDYVAGVAGEAVSVGAAPSTTASSGVGVSFSTTSRVVVAVVMHVPGPRQGGLVVGQPRVEEQNGGRQLLLIPLDDDGNVLMKPSLDGRISRCAGGGPPLATISRQLDTFVPHTSVDYPYLFNQPLAPGCYVLDISARYEGGPLGTFHHQFQVGRTTATTGPNRGQAGEAHATTSHPRGVLSSVLIVLASGLAVAAGLLLLIFWRRRHRLSPAARP